MHGTLNAIALWPRRSSQTYGIRLPPLSEVRPPEYFTKSKTPCLPGFTPVNMLVQAGGVSAGRVERRAATVPEPLMRRKLGSAPDSMSGRRMLQSAPSSPSTTSLAAIGLFLPGNILNQPSSGYVMRDGWKKEGPALDELVLETKDGRKGKRALAIVITSFQARESLAEHLRRLSRQSRKDFDIIAVYGEKDEFLETPGWAGVLHVREKGRMGCAGANYIGQKIALQEGYESVILADDDCMPVSDDLVEKLAGSPGDCAMPNAGYGGQEAVSGFIIHHYGILRRGALEKAGLTYLPFGNGGEDLELIARIRKAGMKISHADAGGCHPAAAPMMLEGGGRLFHYQWGLLL